VAAAITAPDEPSLPSFTSPPASAEPAAAAAPDGTEPVRAVEPKISGGSAAGADEPAPDLAEVLPEVPLAVTYSSAEKAFFEGRYGVAAGMFASYCDQHPENAWGHYMHGLSLRKAGDQQAARGAFNEALLIKPDHLKSLVNLARVQLDLDDAEGALISVQQAVAIAPENVDARRVLGRVYDRLDRQDEAVDTYLGVLRQRPDDAWTLNNLALIWIEAGQADRAVAPLARAAELAPEVGVIRNNLATALEATGHLGQARAQFALAAGLGSDRAVASQARLEAVTIGQDDASLDLELVASGWMVPASDGTTAAVAAVSLDEAELTSER
jgi:Flp pilus assembly protein TadD